VRAEERSVSTQADRCLDVTIQRATGGLSKLGEESLGEKKRERNRFVEEEDDRRREKIGFAFQAGADDEPSRQISELN